MTKLRWLLALGLIGPGGCAPVSDPAQPTLSTAMGWRFGPGLSCRDRTLFQACPEVVQRRGAWFLSWTYGEDTFYYTPNYQARGDRLVFALQATSSTGNPSGRSAELPLEDHEAVAALLRGGAVWWEPDGSYVPLRVLPEGPDSPGQRD